MVDYRAGNYDRTKNYTLNPGVRTVTCPDGRVLEILTGVTLLATDTHVVFDGETMTLDQAKTKFNRKLEFDGYRAQIAAAEKRAKRHKLYDLLLFAVIFGIGQVIAYYFGAGFFS